MQVAVLVLGALAVFWFAYFTYGPRMTRAVGADDARPTPAHVHRDDTDYVPTKRPVLFGHHFASVAGAGPIVGPVVAAAAFGWLPALLWIVIANPLIGAVHDYTSTMGSVRHGGRSMGALVERYMGRRAGGLFLVFTLLLVVLVIAVFAIVVAIVFEQQPSAATASVLFVALALAFGALSRRGLGLGAGTAVFVPLVLAAVWAGLQYPVRLDATQWLPILLAYSFLASVLPVWALLQPRDYLSSFLLFGGLGAAFVGILVGGVTMADPVVLPAFTNLMGNGFGPLFPILFVTIACGAVSGAHCLVACGTTSKQLDRESDARAVGYGGMIMEGVVAVLAVATIAVVGVRGPVSEGLSFALPAFANGGAVFLSHLGVPLAVGATLMALLLSSFLLTSLDTIARLGRYLLEELSPYLDAGPVGRPVARGAANMYVATAVPIGAAWALAAGGAWETLWPLFGAANQLLAGLALFGVTAWLAHSARNARPWATGIPGAFIFVTTMTALVYLAYRSATAPGATGVHLVRALVALLLAALAAWLAVDTWRSVRSAAVVPPEPAAPPVPQP